MNESQEIRHATTVALCGAAILIEGPSGSGKSSLALDLMAWGADLVADDRTLLRVVDGKVLAEAPPNLPSLIEARGIGLLPARLVGPVPVGLVIRMEPVETARMPEPATCCVLGHNVTLIHKSESAHFAQGVLQYVRGTYAVSS